MVRIEEKPCFYFHYIYNLLDQLKRNQNGMDIFLFQFGYVHVFAEFLCECYLSSYLRANSVSAPIFLSAEFLNKRPGAYSKKYGMSIASCLYRIPTLKLLFSVLMLIRVPCYLSKVLSRIRRMSPLPLRLHFIHLELRKDWGEVSPFPCSVRKTRRYQTRKIGSVNGPSQAFLSLSCHYLLGIPLFWVRVSPCSGYPRT